MSARKRRRRRLPQKVEDEIFRLYYEGKKTGREIEVALYDEGKLKVEDIPHVRTIQYRVQDFEKTDTSGPWDWQADANPAPTLKALAAVVERTQGRKATFTQAEAKKIALVLKAAPDCPPWLAYITARYYLWQEQDSESTTGLDAFLAFAPWRSTEAQPCYMAAIAKGLPGCPGLLLYEAVGFYSEEAKARRSKTPLEEVEGYNDSPYRELLEPPSFRAAYTSPQADPT